MKKFSLAKMQRGWFVGDFEPTVLRSCDCEVAVKEYKQDDIEGEHFHLKSTEVTVVLNGAAEIGGVRFGHGDIVVVSPGESVSFKAITDVTTVVFKDGSIAGDKFPGKWLGRGNDGDI